MDVRLSTSVEEREKRRVAHLQKYHEELRQRFLCPNVRLTGRDEQALRLQMDEKARRVQEEKDDDMKYAQFIREMNAQIDELDLQRSEQSRRVAAGIRTEWERASAMKKEKAQREREELRDAELNPKYAGIQPTSEMAHGKKSLQQQLQQQQMREWMAEAEAAKRRNQEIEKAEEDAYHAHVLRMNKQCLDIESECLRYDHQRKRECMLENMRLSKERAERADAERKRVEEHERKEVDEAMNGEFLTESNRTGKSALGEHRYRTDHFKGMTKEETAQFLRDQRIVLESKAREEDTKAEEDAAWARQQKKLLQFSDHFAHDDQLERKKQARECLEFQKAQIEAKTKQREQQRKYDREDVIQAAFFERFGKSHR